MAPSKPCTQLAILCALTLYPQVGWAKLASSSLLVMPLSATNIAYVNGQPQYSTSLAPALLAPAGVALPDTWARAPALLAPAGAELPDSWILTPAMGPTQQWGLTLHVFQLAAPMPGVQRWLQQVAANCVVLTDVITLENVNPDKSRSWEEPLFPQHYDQGFALPNDAPQLLWMCADATQLYSLMQWQETLLWTVNARHPSKGEETRDHFAQFLAEMGAVELQSTSTVFDQVSVYQTSRTLFALQADMEVFRQRYGVHFNEQQRVHNGFLITWQQGPSRTHVSAVRQTDGQVIITRVTGTNL